MNARTAVVDWSGNYEENCIRLGKILGTSKIRRKLFNTIYGRGTKPRSRKQMVTDAGLRAADGQQAQNELDILASCGLIHRVKNDGQVSDRSKWVYSKDPDVRAHRADIVKFADKPSLAKKIATKRNPIVRGFAKNIVVRHAIVTRQALRRRKHLDVLYLTASPIRKHHLRVDAEVRAVVEEIRGSQYRDNITLHQSPAADLNSVIRGLNDHRPRIVHFSGHGNSAGLAGDDGGVKRVKKQFVTFDILGQAFAATDNPPEVVVLNACESAGARNALLRTVKALVVMQESVSDVAAASFAKMFYGGIASGQSLHSAFEQGRVAVAAVSLGESSIPALVTAVGVNAKKLILA